MIETEEQRRWWFATHPQYSWSRRGIRGGSGGEANDDKLDPKEVDAYVDEALKYETGPVADLLKSVKRNFGTEGSLPKRATGTQLSREANAADVGTDNPTDDQSRNGSFGSAYDWARDNWEEALRAIRDYLTGVGPAIVTPTQAKYPSADEMAKRLGTTEDDFHTRIKREITRDFRSELKKIGSPKNIDVGVDRNGNIVLKSKTTGREINTGVPLKTYSK
jgi:hypothetical protein